MVPKRSGAKSNARLRWANRVVLPPGFAMLAPFVLLLIPALLWFNAPSFVWTRVDSFYVTSLVFIGLLAASMISFEARRAPYSLHLVHWIFVYVFFFAAPLVQYRVGVFPWRRLVSSETETLLNINLAILVWCSVWIVTRLAQGRALAHSYLPLGPRISATGVLCTLVLAVGAASYLLWSIGLEALLIRAEYKENLSEAFNTSALALVLDKVLRGLPVAAAAGALWFLRSRRAPLSIRLGAVAASLVLLLIADFPLGSGRYWAGAIYLGLVLTIFDKRLRSGWPFALLLVSGLLIVFPLLGDMRNANSFSQAISSMGDGLQEEALATGDFDAYTMVGYTAEYISEGPGITYGRQLLGTLLFFVPRAVWPEKPVGSGWMVAVESNLSFENVSSPPIAEGLINFGWAGIVLFAFTLSWAFGVLDASFRRAESEGSGSLLRIIYPFWIGFAFLLLRGDLLSSTAFIIGFSVSFMPLLIRLPKLQPSANIGKVRGRAMKESGFRSVRMR